MASRRSYFLLFTSACWNLCPQSILSLFLFITLQFTFCCDFRLFLLISSSSSCSSSSFRSSKSLLFLSILRSGILRDEDPSSDFGKLEEPLVGDKSLPRLEFCCCCCWLGANSILRSFSVSYYPETVSPFLSFPFSPKTEYLQHSARTTNWRSCYFLFVDQTDNWKLTGDFCSLSSIQQCYLTRQARRRRGSELFFSLSLSLHLDV